MLGQERISRGGWTDGRRLRLRAANEDESGHARARIPLKKNLYAGVRWRVLQRLRQGRGRVDAEYLHTLAFGLPFIKVAAAAQLHSGWRRA